MSKIIYQPKGNAAEYSPWAANFYNGCSNRCDYCYNRHGIGKNILGKDEPTLKNSFGSDYDAINVFRSELEKYKEQIIADGKGLFFNFVSDPMLPETRGLNIACILGAAHFYHIPCVILTKCADWYGDFLRQTKIPDTNGMNDYLNYIKFGFTLTGCDELEHGASTNADRIALMKKLHEDGFKTWASIEPVIDPERSLEMVRQAAPYCDEFKIGLLSGKKCYTPKQLHDLTTKTYVLASTYHFDVYLKKSVRDFLLKGLGGFSCVLIYKNAHDLVCERAHG